MAYYNVPTPGAATRTEALVEFARRNTPEGRNKLRESEFEALRAGRQGLVYQGDGGREVYVRWADLTSEDMALICQ